MPNLRSIDLDETFFEGGVSFEKGAGWIKAWRIPFSERSLFPPDDGVPHQAQKGSGVRLRFQTNSRRVGLKFLPVLPEDETEQEVDLRCFDLTLGGEIVGSKTVEHTDRQVVFDQLPAGDKLVQLWLPIHSPTRLSHLLVDPGAEAAVVSDERPRWITYGTSITNCRAAHSPARTWPAIVSRRHDLNLTSLGFGGQCHLDPMVARMIRDLEADFVSLKLSVNVLGAASMSERTFGPAVIGTVKIIREKHPDIPIALISPIIAPERERQPNQVGMSLARMRACVEEAFTRLVGCGDRNLHYFSGLDLFGEELADRYLPDGLHPDGDGYEVLAENFSRVVMSRVRL